MGKPAIEVKNVSILFNMNKEKVDNRKRHGYTIFICCK